MELGIQRMINNKVLLKIIRKYINYPVINHMKKNKKKNIYFSMCMSHISVQQNITQHWRLATLQ